MNQVDQAALMPRSIRLELCVREPEVVVELNKHREGTERDEFGLSALRIGVLALRQASGALDANVVRVEGERLVGAVRELLTTNTTGFLANVSSTLKSYFDPSEGHLPQRLDRLIKKDGELQRLLANHLDGDESVVARTLAKHIGEESPLLRLLAPEESDGIVASLTKAVSETLELQRTHILRQFSLDDKESALSRLVSEMTGNNGQLRKELAQDVQKLHDEFSLDNDQGSLSRLMARVEKAQRTISDQFSLNNKESALCRLVGLMETANLTINANLTLDNENSPLYRLRRELTEIIQRMQESSTAFHEEVKLTLESFKVRREEAARSTRHGGDFEEAVGTMLQGEAQNSGDVFEPTGNKTGVNPYCKKGDHVVTLGAESAVPGARIVVEAKEDKSYDLAKALKEIEQGRQNREAQVGLFVFSRATAPAGLDPFARHGKHIIVVWDRDDPATDIYLRVGLSVAKALVIRERLSDAKSKSDLVALKTALVAITSNLKVLDEIGKWATTVKRNGEKISKKAATLRKKLDKNLSTLEKQLAAGSGTGNGQAEVTSLAAT
jgi:energy-converting hydrogenase A subunit M